ncbi:hypothetical protein EV691_10913 [Azotobacter chroococcum]|uniref:Uncharacterized protein n=1 Tax=Azotobacter chroococcum TaxID=353 RepID=A0A4R1PLD1_9GAMM|nr:hypothetical protein EV691_10913 [Azotobacter chroococcum]
MRESEGPGSPQLPSMSCMVAIIRYALFIFRKFNYLGRFFRWLAALHCVTFA